MKKTVLFAFIIFSCSFLSAQIPNNGFENWTSFGSYDLPDQWKTTDSVSTQLGIHTAVKEFSDVQSGNYSIALTSWTYSVYQGLPGCASNGDVEVNLFPPSVSPVKGSPDNVRHAFLNGYYKYDTTAGGRDTGSIEVCLFLRNTVTGNRDTVAFGSLPTQQHAGYTWFQVHLNPVSAATPDTMLIWLQSSPRNPLGSGRTGSVLKVDSLYFTSVIGSGISESNSPLLSVSFYPVPVRDFISIKLAYRQHVPVSLLLFDECGKMVLQKRLLQEEETIDLSRLPAAVYPYRLQDDAGNALFDGKLVKE